MRVLQEAGSVGDADSIVLDVGGHRVVGPQEIDREAAAVLCEKAGPQADGLP